MTERHGERERVIMMKENAAIAISMSKTLKGTFKGFKRSENRIEQGRVREQKLLP